VVGHDGRLFEYFLPERWRHRQIPLSASSRVWYTRTKDGVHLVWKVSRVGETPEGDPSDPRVRSLRECGYNSPFEEFSLALALLGKGMGAAYPRAIYVTGQDHYLPGAVTDDRRFDRLAGEPGPDGQPVLRYGPDYITIWGYWRGHEDDVAADAKFLWSPIGAGQAMAKGLVSRQQLDEIMVAHADRLRRAGFEDLNLEPDHVMLTYVPGGTFLRDATGAVSSRHCNFELVRKIP
jgi:hypothetical protein